jgi:hypothetical protein
MRISCLFYFSPCFSLHSFSIENELRRCTSIEMVGRNMRLLCLTLNMQIAHIVKARVFELRRPTVCYSFCTTEMNAPRVMESFCMIEIRRRKQSIVVGIFRKEEHRVPVVTSHEANLLLLNDRPWDFLPLSRIKEYVSTSDRLFAKSFHIN